MRDTDRGGGGELATGADQRVGTVQVLVENRDVQGRLVKHAAYREHVRLCVCMCLRVCVCVYVCVFVCVCV
jgi:hypothetical protein